MPNFFSAFLNACNTDERRCSNACTIDTIDNYNYILCELKIITDKLENVSILSRLCLSLKLSLWRALWLSLWLSLWRARSFRLWSSQTTLAYKCDLFSYTSIVKPDDSERFNNVRTVSRSPRALLKLDFLANECVCCLH